MLVSKPKKELLNFVKDWLLRPDFVVEFKRLVSEGKLRLYIRDPELKQYISHHTGVPVEDLEPVWRDVYSLLSKIYFGEIKIKKVESASASFISPASIIYFALYEVEGEKASEIMYYLLEPLLVPILSGDGNANLQYRNLFIPINGKDAESTIKLVADIVSRGSEYLCRPEALRVLRLLCTITEHLPSSKRNVMPDVTVCQQAFKKYIEEGACNGGKELH